MDGTGVDFRKNEDARGWVIEQLTGRGTRGGKGLAAAHSMVSRGPDGQQMSVERMTREFSSAQGRILFTAERLEFDRCPICLTSGPTSEEHVPPNSLGGTRMTLTCEACNHRFGSRLEADLLDWWEDAYTLVKLEHDDVIGARRVARVLVRQTSTGEFAVLADRPDPAISQAMAPDTNLSMHVRLPDPARWRLGAIKSAYLGACLLTRSIPATPEADAVRADLLAARDGHRQAALVLSDHCRSLNVYRTQGPAQPGEIALVEMQSDDGGAPELLVSLARTLLVSWPVGGYLAEVDSATGEAVSVVPLAASAVPDAQNGE